MKKNNYTFGWYKVFSLFICLALGVVGVNAQSTTSTTGDWNTTGTWGGTLPAAGNTVTVNKAITINAAVVNTVGAITIASGGTITIGASGALNAASITIQSGGTLDMTAAGTINLTGTLTNSGTYTNGAGVVATNVFGDNFNRTVGNSSTSMTSPADAGGTPSATYAVNPSTLTSVYLNGASLQMSAANTTIVTGYVTAPIGVNSTNVPAPFNATLSSNTGLVTWYVNMRHSASSAPINASAMVSTVIAGTSSTFSSGNGYAICMVSGNTSGNTVQFGYYTSGLTIATFHSLATISNIIIAQNYFSAKVTYNPITQAWTLSIGALTNVSAASTDPTITSYTNSASPVVDATYTGTAMSYFGYQFISKSTNSAYFDNFNITTASLIATPSALSAFSYISGSGPSATQTFTAAASGLGTNSLIVTPPVGYEISTSSSFTAGSTTASSTTSPAYLSLTPASGAVSQTIYVRLKASLANGTYSGNIAISSLGAALVNEAVIGSVAPPAPSALTVANIADTREYLTWSAPSDGSNVLVIAYNASTAYPNPTANGGTYTANPIYTSAPSAGNGGVVVYSGTGTNVEVTGLTSGTTYYYQAISYSGSVYAANSTASATAAVQPVTAFTASQANAQSVLSWTNPSFNATQSKYWDQVMVIASTSSISAPSGNSYTGPSGSSISLTSGTAYGSGYIVYYGTGTGVTVTGLTNLTAYNYAVYVRHGSVWSAVTATNQTASIYANGDYVSAASGNYSTAATWNTWNGSSLVTTASPPTASNNVWIDNGYTVALSAAGSCNNLHVINGIIETGSYSGSTLTATTVSTTTVGSATTLSVAGSTIEVQSGGQIGAPLTGGQTGDNANALVLFTTASGSSSSALATVTIFGTGGTINVAKLLINANNQSLVISHDVNVYYHTSSNNGNGQAFGVAGTASSNWTDAITISSGFTLTMGQLAGISLASSTGTSVQVNFTLNVSGTINFTRGRTPIAIAAGTGTNGAFALNTASGYAATINVLNGGNIYATEVYPNGSAASVAVGAGQLSTINIASGGTFTVDSLIDLRSASQTITGAGTFKILSNAGSTSNNASATIIKIGAVTGLDAQVLASTKIYDSYTTFSYEGTVAQNTGTSLPSSVYNLNINNSFGVTLSQATTVNDSLKMVNGLLTTTSTNLLTMGTPNPNAIIQSTTTSYVYGPLAFTVASTGSTSKTFPIGSATVYSPVTLNVTQNTVSARTYTAQVVIGGTTPSHTIPGTIGAVSPNRYYTLSTNGSNNITAASITLGYSTIDVNAGINTFSTNTASKMRIVGSSGWTDLGGTGSAPVTGAITSTTNFTALGDFAVANVYSTTVTPPNLTAASGATVGANYDITFTDDGTFGSHITSVVYGGVTLVRNTDYTVSGTGSNAKITIMPNGATGSVLRTAASNTVTISATNYDDAVVTQITAATTASKLFVHTAPVATSNGVVFSTQPVVYITDAYNNLVTSASDNITPSNNGASNWLLGGTTTALATSGGAATFTNLSGASSTAITATITFTSVSYGSVTTTFSLVAPPTYYWVGGVGSSSQVWSTGNLWATKSVVGGVTTYNKLASYTPSSTDILVFDGSNIDGNGTALGSNTIVTYATSSTTSIGQIILQNAATVSLSPTGSARTYTITGLYGTDLVVPAGCTLETVTSSTTSIIIGTGATASISGNILLSTGGSTLIGTDAGSVVFNSGSICTVNVTSTVTPFGTGTGGSVVFSAGSQLIITKAGDIFGGNNVLLFDAGSTLNIQFNYAAFIFDNHTFGNVIIATSGTATTSAGSNGFTCTSLSVQSGSLSVAETGTCSYGALSTSTGTTLTLSTAPTYTSITNSGTLNLTYTPISLAGTIGGTVGLTSPTAVQTLNASGTLNLNNLTVNNTTASSPGAVLTGTINITGALTVTNGNLNTSGATVTLKSTSIANTGIVGTVGSGGSFTGSVAVERYIPAGFRAYRDMVPEVYGAGSIYNNWQSGGTMTSGKGIFITGPGAIDAVASDYNSGQPNAASSGLDYSINGNASAFIYTNSTGSWNSPTGITNTTTINLDAFQGYRVLIRGDRSFNLATTPIVNYYGIGLRMVNATTLNATGNLVYGTVTYNTTNASGNANGGAVSSSAVALNNTVNGFSMIANPYVCPVQWGTGTATNNSNTTIYGASSHINGSYWYLDPTSGDGGKYIAFNAITGTAVSGYTSTSTVTSTGYIQPGQAVFVQTSASSPTVVFKETAKAAASAKASVFGVTTPLSKIYLSLDKLNATTGSYDRLDGAAIAFSDNFGNTDYGPQDALKFGNANDNLYITDKGKNLSIDGRLPATATDKLPIAISKVSGTNYQLVIDATNYTANGFAPYLIDSYRGTVTTLTNGENTISFTADATISASFANRFSIVFKPTTLAVNSLIASATLNNKIATISWNTVGEKGVSRFEVEKSSDATSFTKIGQSAAKNTATATYSATDNSVTATSYYRIKAISEVGTVSYSNIAKVTYNVQLTTYNLYPNPLVGKTLNVSLSNVSAGKYTVTITSLLGQKIQEATINHQGGSASHAITISNTLAAGTYSVTVRDANNQVVHQSNLSIQP